VIEGKLGEPFEGKEGRLALRTGNTTLGRETGRIAVWKKEQAIKEKIFRGEGEGNLVL